MVCILLAEIDIKISVFKMILAEKIYYISEIIFHSCTQYTY
jgi:hypothetical protein